MNLKDIIWQGIHAVAELHDGIERYFREAGLRLNDKELHFLVFGAAGALVLLAVWILFWRLRRHPGVLAFLFTLVLMTLLALAVEMGQQLSGGRMDLYDIAAGLGGYLVFSGAIAAAASLVLSVRWLFTRKKKRRE